jgi:hypothetical protein
MPEPVYFQWQNEHLLRSIYPLREMKLRDFLTYYREIELWQDYKDKTLDELQDEVVRLKEERARQWKTQFQTYQDQQNYFLKADVSQNYQARFSDLDTEVMEKINQLHRSFNKYFPSYGNIRKEKIFLSRQVSQWEDYRRSLQERLSKSQRTLRNMQPDWVHREKTEQEAKKLKDVSLPMADEELNNLYAFLSGFSKIEDQRKALTKWKADQEKALVDLGNKRLKRSQDVEAAESKLQDESAVLELLKNPPDYEPLKNDFLSGEITQKFRRKFSEPDESFMSLVELAFKEFQRWLPEQAELQDQERLVEKLIRTYSTQWKWRKGVAGQMAAGALAEMERFRAALHARNLTMEQRQAEIQAQLETRSQSEAKLTKLREDLEQLEIDIRKIQVEMETQEGERMGQFAASQAVGLRDIVQGKVEAYQAGLANKDQTQLLEEIVQNFVQAPERYPLWLQYMVVHFSGMRYKSAHGSWANPRDLLIALRIHAVEKEMAVDNEIIQARCVNKLEGYRAALEAEEDQDDLGLSFQVPKLAQVSDPKLKARLETHLEGLESSNPYRQRRALMNLCIDEESYGVEDLPEEEVLEELEEMKGDLPDWMWKEIVELTHLRLTEVTSDDWEKLTPEELEEKRQRESGDYREIMNKWKRSNLTAWREEHDRTNRMIVTRAVCNEVAEHIQHLRGLSPPGGLTAKPEWYLRKERDPKLAALSRKPYFVKPHLAKDFRPGASILWLRFVDSQPNAWQIAHPLRLKSGEGLLSSQLDFAKGSPSKALKRKKDQGRKDWVYQQDGSGYYKRFRQVPAGDNPKKHKLQGQWLRWMHEATVVEVAETADGPVVLTFETALPYEDRRRSTIGVFKHSLSGLKYDLTGRFFNATFVGYVPPGDIPFGDLREMLDWNKVLRKEFLSPDETQAFWEKATQPPEEVESENQPEPAAIVRDPGRPAEVCPPVMKLGQHHQESISCYAVEAASQQAQPYKPKVDLMRGTLLFVSQDRALRVRGIRYIPVVRCDAAPRAQDLYVRAEEVIELPDSGSSRPVKAREKLNMWTIRYANKAGFPVLEQYLTQDKQKIQLMPGSVFRISSVHRISAEDKGDGLIRADGKREYYLVVDCPGLSCGDGLFVRPDQIEPISEEAYARALRLLELQGG